MTTIADAAPLVGMYLAAFSVGFCGGYLIRLFRRLGDQLG